MTYPSPAPVGPAASALMTAVPYSHPDARRLIRALHTEQVDTYGFAEDPDATPEAHFDPPQGLFVIAHRDGKALACGGVRLMPDSRTAEIKRMYVAPAARGHGLGRRLLEHLEQHAVSLGATTAVLETGHRNAAALTLYRHVGYKPRPSYVAGRDPLVNRAMTKSLSSNPS